MAKGVCNMALNGTSYNTKKEKLTARGRNSPTEPKSCGQQRRTKTRCTESALWCGEGC